MSENNFAELYKTWPTDQLLSVVDNPDHYEPSALEAAEIELKSRQLTTEELTVARYVLNQREAEKETNIDTIKAKDQWTITGRFDTPRVQVVKRSIVRISFFTGILIVFKGYNLFPALLYPIKYFKELPDNYTLLSFFNVMVLIVGFLLFWLLKRTGWILLTLFFASSSSMVVSTLMYMLFQSRREAKILVEFNPILQPYPLEMYILPILLYGFLTWILCTKKIRECYFISKTAMFWTLAVGILLIPCLSFWLML